MTWDSRDDYVGPCKACNYEYHYATAEYGDRERYPQYHDCPICGYGQQFEGKISETIRDNFEGKIKIDSSGKVHVDYNYSQVIDLVMKKVLGAWPSPIKLLEQRLKK